MSVSLTEDPVALPGKGSVRQCKRCRTYKKSDQFYANGGRLRSICIECDKQRVDAWSKSHPDERKKVYRRRHLKRTFGITLEQFEEMEKQQNGGCAICRRTVRDIRHHKLCVDHCHRTGAVRGLLCFDCNIAIGMLADCPELIERAGKYLRGELFPILSAPENKIEIDERKISIQTSNS